MNSSHIDHVDRNVGGRVGDTIRLSGGRLMHKAIVCHSREYTQMLCFCGFSQMFLVLCVLLCLRLKRECQEGSCLSL